MMTRIMALLLAAVLCLTLFTGCGGNGDAVETTPTPEPTTPPAVIDYDAAFAKYDPATVVMTVDGKDVTWSEFFYMLYSSLTQIEYYMGEIRWADELVEGMTFDGYTMDMTMTMLKQMHAVENKSNELKLKLTADDHKLIEDNKVSVMAQYCGENATEEDFEAFLLSKLYLTPDVYTYINENSLKYEKLFTESIGAAGEKIPEEEVAIIRDSKVVEKRTLALPKRLTNVIKCKNPRCITTTEQELAHVFVLTDPEKHVYRCLYCETQANK